jgi:hypothetical protein
MSKSKMFRAMFALICAAILAGCGGDPGSSGDSSGETDPSGSTGSGTTQPHIVTIPVTLVAGDTTDTVAEIATVNVWRNTQATPMGTMPVSYTAYEADPVEIDANEEDLLQIGIDVAIVGCQAAVVPMPILSVEQLRAVGDSFPVSVLVARNLTEGVWVCAETITKNGAPFLNDTKTTSVTMNIDVARGTWIWGFEAFSGIYRILGDTVSADDNDEIVSGTVTQNGAVLDMTVTYKADASTVISFHCTR